MKYQWINQRITGRFFRGRDFDTEGRMLMTIGDPRPGAPEPELELVWRQGGQRWVHIGKQAYHPAHLEIHAVRMGRAGRPEVIHQMLQVGGRLTLKMLKKHMAAIREFSEIPELDISMFRLDKTLVLEP
jgi:hypothetical protein